MKKNLKKLKLNKITVQVLTKEQQNKVNGGNTARGSQIESSPTVNNQTRCHC